MYEVTVTRRFPAAHYYHKGRTSPESSMHGHTFEVEVVFCRKNVDENGVVGLPRDLNKVVGSAYSDFAYKTINDLEPFDEMNPTPELLARYFFEWVQKALLCGGPKGLKVVCVSVSTGDELIATYRASAMTRKWPTSKAVKKPCIG